MKKGTYVDGYVISIPKKNKAKYMKMAREGLQVWKKFGAIDYKECIGDDLASDDGMKGLGFPKMAGARKDEVVWFSFVTYKNKKHRDEVNKKVMDYLAKKYTDADMKMPFNMKRFASGGFKVVVGM